MTLGEITELVLDVVQDDSFEDSIPLFINQTIMELGRFKLSTLDSEDVVSCLATEPSVALPDDYLHGLYSVHNGSEYVGTPAYYNDYSRFLRYNKDRESIGKIHDVAVRGLNLFYAQREDIDLSIRYFCKPTKLESISDEPDFLPEHLHEPILVNSAAYRIYNLIEDGIEDPKTNTKIYQSLYQMGIQDLQMFVVNTDQPIYIQDEYEV